MRWRDARIVPGHGNRGLLRHRRLGVLRRSSIVEGTRHAIPVPPHDPGRPVCRAAGHARFAACPEHVQTDQDGPVERHERPLSRRRRARQPAGGRDGDRGFRRLRPRAAGRNPAGRRPEQARYRRRHRARMDRQPGAGRHDGWRRQLRRFGDPDGGPREEAHLSHHRPGDVRHDGQAVLPLRCAFLLRHLRPSRMAPAPL